MSKRDSYDDCNSAREQQEYYERHQNEIPEGCRACGGPYPSCKDGCPMFDDED